MIIKIRHNNKNYSINLNKPLDISIPYDFKTIIEFNGCWTIPNTDTTGTP